MGLWQYGAEMAASEQQRLRSTGIEVLVAEEDTQMRFECLRAAQRLHRSGCTTIGLVPASAEVGVVGVGVNLALALAELTGSTVGYVDANQRWPALARFVDGLAKDTDSEAAFSTHWMRGNVALLVPRTPRGRGVAGSELKALSQALDSAREPFARCLVDLTGFARLGEHLHAFALLDGVVIVAQAGLTNEEELLALKEELPAKRLLGVLLVGLESMKP